VNFGVFNEKLDFQAPSAALAPHCSSYGRHLGLPHPASRPASLAPRISTPPGVLTESLAFQALSAILAPQRSKLLPPSRPPSPRPSLRRSRLRLECSTRISSSKHRRRRLHRYAQAAAATSISFTPTVAAAARISAPLRVLNVKLVLKGSDYAVDHSRMHLSCPRGLTLLI
jgi:hypothetical protein